MTQTAAGKNWTKLLQHILKETSQHQNTIPMLLLIVCCEVAKTSGQYYSG